MTDHKLILTNISEDEGIAWLTLNRPEKKNALSISLLSELADELRAIRDNEKIRCIGGRRQLLFWTRSLRHAKSRPPEAHSRR